MWGLGHNGAGFESQTRKLQPAEVHRSCALDVSYDPGQREGEETVVADLGLSSRRQQEGRSDGREELRLDSVPDCPEGAEASESPGCQRCLSNHGGHLQLGPTPAAAR